MFLFKIFRFDNDHPTHFPSVCLFREVERKESTVTLYFKCNSVDPEMAWEPNFNLKYIRNYWKNIKPF